LKVGLILMTGLPSLEGIPQAVQIWSWQLLRSLQVRAISINSTY